MDKTWTWRDWIFLLLFLLIAVLIALQIWQNERQFEQLAELKTGFNEFRKLAQRGAFAGGSDAQSNTGDEKTQKPTGDWLVIRTLEPTTLNNITRSDVYASSVNGRIMETLLDRNSETLKLEPELAESMPEISEDKKQFTFRLRKGIRWHDGEPLTAHDVKFSFDTIMNPKVDCQNRRNYFQDIEKVEVLDDYTIRFTAKNVYWLWVSMLGGMSLVPKHIFDYPADKAEEFNTNEAGRAPVGTGPYKFLKWDEGSQIVLVRNPEYWNPQKAAHLDRVVFKIIREDTTAMERVKKGEIDYYGCTIKQWFNDATKPEVTEKFDRITYDSLSYNYIGWNQRAVFFKDKRVRRAMTHALPRKEFLKTRMQGFGQVVTGNFYVNGPACNKDIKPWPYDPDESRRLLDEAGWKDRDGDGIRENEKGQKFDFQLMIPRGRKLTEDLALTLKTELAKIGVRMSTRLLDWAAFIGEIDKRNFEAVSLGWSMGLEPDPYQLWHSSQTGASGSNFCKFVNKEADELIVAARREFDEDKRNRMFHRFHEIMHEEQPYTFLFNVPARLLAQKRFRHGDLTLDRTRDPIPYPYPLGPDTHEWWVPLDKQMRGTGL